MNGYNNDIQHEQINKLKQLFPEAVTEGKIDWQKLQATLGEAVDLGERYGLGWKGKSKDSGNRRWICVQLPELIDEKSEAYKAGYSTITDIARERIRRAGTKIHTDQADKLASRNVPLDLGFRAYRVGDSNFKQWNELVSDPEEIRQQALANLDPLEEGTTDDDLLAELLLKRGISPLVQIDQCDSFCFIPSEKLVICLAHSMTEELFATILAFKPSSIILLDRAFGDDVNLKVNLLLQAERQGVEVEVV